jgi:hypothetical protein
MGDLMNQQVTEAPEWSLEKKAEPTATVEKVKPPKSGTPDQQHNGRPLEKQRSGPPGESGSVEWLQWHAKQEAIEGLLHERKSLKHFLESGRHLNVLYEKLGYGAYGEWLEADFLKVCPVADVTTRRWRRFARLFDEALEAGNSVTVTVLEDGKLVAGIDALEVALGRVEPAEEGEDSEDVEDTESVEDTEPIGDDDEGEMINEIAPGTYAETPEQLAERERKATFRQNGEVPIRMSLAEQEEFVRMVRIVRRHYDLEQLKDCVLRVFRETVERIEAADDQQTHDSAESAADGASASTAEAVL